MVKKIVILSVLAAIVVASYYLIFSKDSFDSVSDLINPRSEEEIYLQSITDKEVIKNVFYTLPDRVFKPEYGGKIFCSEKIYGYDINSVNKNLNVFVYANCEEYYLKNDKPTLGKIRSTPLKIIFIADKNKIDFDSIKLPDESNRLEEELKNIFPDKYYQEAIIPLDIDLLVPSPKTQAENYYQGKLEVYF